MNIEPLDFLIFEKLQDQYKNKFRRSNGSIGLNIDIINDFLSDKDYSLKDLMSFRISRQKIESECEKYSELKKNKKNIEMSSKEGIEDNFYNTFKGALQLKNYGFNVEYISFIYYFIEDGNIDFLISELGEDFVFNNVSFDENGQSIPLFYNYIFNAIYKFGNFSTGIKKTKDLLGKYTAKKLKDNNNYIKSDNVEYILFLDTIYFEENIYIKFQEQLSFDFLSRYFKRKEEKNNILGFSFRFEEVVLFLNCINRVLINGKPEIKKEIINNYIKDEDYLDFFIAYLIEYIKNPAGRLNYQGDKSLRYMFNLLNTLKENDLIEHIINLSNKNSDYLSEKYKNEKEILKGKDNHKALMLNLINIRDLDCLDFLIKNNHKISLVEIDLLKKGRVYNNFIKSHAEMFNVKKEIDIEFNKMMLKGIKNKKDEISLNNFIIDNKVKIQELIKKERLKSKFIDYFYFKKTDIPVKASTLIQCINNGNLSELAILIKNGICLDEKEISLLYFIFHFYKSEQHLNLSESFGILIDYIKKESAGNKKAFILNLFKYKNVISVCKDFILHTDSLIDILKDIKNELSEKEKHDFYNNVEKNGLSLLFLTEVLQKAEQKDFFEECGWDYEDISHLLLNYFNNRDNLFNGKLVPDPIIRIMENIVINTIHLNKSNETYINEIEKNILKLGYVNNKYKNIFKIEIEKVKINIAINEDKINENSCKKRL